ncbi:alpha/beta hydrolase fold protein [Pseudarthrobacter chlorophenolicus A6]|uniref:Alpha/beta hydrolase fold protein n=1 Tax=Pseudarthrobacter chlorophenolicus (strain ATCC 700700 / DSM 12829 / CIP 107037 / JCM 12360 / KCTC 9906 / NCIMB 13794 / A6) TaxID=452863 RepID=B8HEN4_PSECP|nr:alpha/beta hydrolase [Pseudarthrobacter chlorophenolicus]ACL40979.1 alpha/beta hydrolase fold protein [Pseudarthrobacter chlorophenolicus A6]SDQ71894.1 Pimeloyl-ACP methyl ester carboxylesterase [Pseudarthrobacter chlorophenolicus]
MFRLREATDAGLRKKPRRGLRRAGFVLLAIVGLLLASTLLNLFLESRERATVQPYGERVAVAGGSLNVVRNGEQGQAIVLLSGLGTPAPGLDFQPLVRELNGFDVMVVEGIGYGYSDMEAGPRSNGNISNELHEALARLRVPQPYVLAGHSIAGFYLLDYANRYRSEVAAVIGIDASIPKPGEGPVEEPPQGINWARILSTTGLVRAVAAVAPAVVDPDSSAFTDDELKRMRMMGSWNYGNPAVADETARIANNAAALRGVTYPDDLPVLAFIADEKTDHTAEKVSAAENLLRNVARHQVLPLEGGHYLHWAQAPRMAEAIRTFLGPAG